jgi:hypothetical protein
LSGVLVGLCAELVVVVDREADDVEQVWVVDDVDAAAAVSADPDESGEFQFGQVLADRGDGLTDLAGEGADVAFPVGEQPQDLQARGGGEDSEGGGGVLEQVVGQGCSGLRGGG